MSEVTTLEFCTTQIDGQIFTVTSNRPERMNALHWKANAELATVFDEFDSNPDLWVAIITGAGDRAFSAGNDLKYQAQEAGGELNTGPETGFAGLTARTTARSRSLQRSTASPWAAASRSRWLAI